MLLNLPSIVNLKMVNTSEVLSIRHVLYLIWCCVHNDAQIQSWMQSYPHMILMNNGVILHCPAVQPSFLLVHIVPLSRLLV